MNVYFEFGLCDLEAWGDVETCLFMTLLKIMSLKCDCTIHYKRKLQLSSRSSKIGLSFVTLSVPSIMGGLDAVDGGWYP